MSPGARRGSRAQMWNKAKHAQKSNRAQHAKHAQTSNRAQHAQRSSSNTGQEAWTDNTLNALSSIPGKTGEFFKRVSNIRNIAKSAKGKSDYDAVIHALDVLIARPEPINLQTFCHSIANLYNLDGFQREILNNMISNYQDDILGGISDAKRLKRIRNLK